MPTCASGTGRTAPDAHVTDISVSAPPLPLDQVQVRTQRGLTYLFIVHELAVVEHISDRIAVMYADRLVEVARPEALFVRPLHPNTEALIGTIPAA